jgi:hypothetical protein
LFDGKGREPSGGVLLPFMPARFVLELETDWSEGRGGEVEGSGGDFPPKTEFSVEDDLFRGISGTGSAAVPS